LLPLLGIVELPLDVPAEAFGLAGGVKLGEQNVERLGVNFHCQLGLCSDKKKFFFV
jgi:hypothetical protein